ncbi:12724_t:CDS:2, partial [Acaulospora colombiana]
MTINADASSSTFPLDLRNLVFEYLTANGYANTAQSMLNDESKRVGSKKLQHLDKRKREQELEQVDLARKRRGKCLLRDHFPDLPYSETPSTSGSSSPTLTPRSRHLPLPTFSTWPTGSCIPPPEKTGTKVEELYATSYGLNYPLHRNLSPTIINLRLRLQGLVEAARTVPLPSLSRNSCTNVVPQPHSGVANTSKRSPTPNQNRRPSSEGLARRALLHSKAESITHTIHGISDLSLQSELLDQLEDAMRALSYDRPEAVLIPSPITKPTTHRASLVNSLLGVQNRDVLYKLQRKDLTHIRSILYRPWSRVADCDKSDEKMVQVADWFGYTRRVELAELLDQSLLHSLGSSPTSLLTMLALQTSAVFSCIHGLSLPWASKTEWHGKEVEPLQRFELEEWDAITEKERAQVERTLDGLPGGNDEEKLGWWDGVRRWLGHGVRREVYDWASDTSSFQSETDDLYYGNWHGFGFQVDWTLPDWEHDPDEVGRLLRSVEEQERGKRWERLWFDELYPGLYTPKESVLKTSASHPTFSQKVLCTPNRYAAERVGGMRISTPSHLRRTALSTPSSNASLLASQTRWQSTTADTAAKETPVSESSASGSTTNGASAETKPANGEKAAEQKQADNAKNGDKSKEKAELEKLKEERDDLMSRLRYLQADLQNAQRIAQVEKDKMKDFAISKFA